MRIHVREWSRLVVCVWATLACFKIHAQHIHLYAGAESSAPSSRLFFSNGYLFDTNSYSYLTPPVPACIFMNDLDPLYPGLHQTAASFAALPATIWTGGPTPFAAEQDAYIEMKIISVQGPPGAEFSFWSENEEATQTTKVFSIPTGTLNGTNQFNLSEGILVPEPDPFGHIHGRRFTASKPGLYTVGVQLIDTSTTGPGGGPVHSPSDTNYFYFQAGLFINWIVHTNGVSALQFGTRAFHDYYVEAVNALPSTNWEVAAQISASDHSDLHVLLDTNAVSTSRFYRLREEPQ
jgi:hypothetical protein